MFVVKKLENGKYFGNDGSGSKFDFDKDMATRFASAQSAHDYLTDPLGAAAISLDHRYVIEEVEK